MAGPIDAKRAVVLLALGGGKSRAAAAAEASINDRTLRKWVTADPEFAALVEVALAKGRSVLEGRIIDAADRDWRAAAWLLEVLHYGRSKAGPVEEQLPDQMVVLPRDGAPAGTVDPERIEIVLRTLREALGEEEFKRWLYARERQIAEERAHRP